MYTCMHFSILEDFLKGINLEKELKFSRLLKDKEIARVVVKNKKTESFYLARIVNEMGKGVILDISAKENHEVFFCEKN